MKIKKEVKVGLLTVVALVLFYFGFKFLKGIDLFDPTDTYYAYYDDVDGLQVSNPVIINGLQVGRVSNIFLEQEGAKTRMMVTLDINDELTLYEGSEAMLVDQNPVLGGKAIILNVKQEGPKLEEESFLVGRRDKALSEILKEKADPIVANVDTTLTRVNNILDDLSGSGSQVETALTDFKITASEVKYMMVENRRDINAITSNLLLLSQALNNPETGVAPFMAKLNQMADTLNNGELSATLAQANQAVANLQQLTANLQNGEGSLGKLISNDSLYANLNTSSENLNNLLLDMRENPERYINIKFSLIGGGD
jgi:phospholipid/cholesterol/gamma-HCH transport system substrate-binding protein